MPGYNLHVRVIQSNPDAWYSIVEKANWHAGYWSEADGQHTLTMDGSGTSGMLRFKNPQDDYFLVALGIHNYNRWCDIEMDSAQTCVEVNPTYYDGNSPRHQMLWKNLQSIEKTSCKCVRVKVNFYKQKDRNYWATITIS